MKTPRFWQTCNLISAALLPLSAVYTIGARLDRRHTKPQTASLPVLSIGNATAGGAGKTPATMALVPLLRQLGYTPHILTRGYHGTAQQAHRVTAQNTAQEVGDEALLLAAAAPTWVGRDRLASANAAAKANADLLLCDDAHQHHRLHKNLSLLVIDGPFGIGNGRLLPAGPLREPFAAALAHAQAVILIGEDKHNIAAHLPVPVFRAELRPTSDTEFLKHHRWLAFAGIGRPQKFYDTLRSLGAEILATRDFPDHHAYTEADAKTLLQHAKNLGATLITTEKDAVKLPPALRAETRVLPVALQFSHPETVTAFLRNHLPSRS